MKKAGLLIAVLGVVFIVVGCQPGAKAGNGAFPAELAGVWKAVDKPWMIQLSKEGTVLWARTPLDVDIRPNETTTVPMKDGSVSTYAAGPAEVQWYAPGRELAVTIAIDNIDIKYEDVRLRGRSRYVFTGEVSKDWKEWIPTYIYESDLGPAFPVDPNDTVETVAFQKAVN